MGKCWSYRSVSEEGRASGYGAWGGRRDQCKQGPEVTMEQPTRNQRSRTLSDEASG